MKKIHIVMLIIVAAGIASLTFFLKDLTTYATFNTATQKYKDKFVHIVASLDTTKSIEWDAEKNPNYMSFYAKDTIAGNGSTKVVYKKEKPNDFEKSSRLVLKGYMRNDHFECKEIQLKCPSKYKDEEAATAVKNIN
jgi:cytochrome c-type biogenesis protein CcmE